MAALTAADFEAYNPSDASSIEAGPQALYSVSVDSILPTQQNEGFTEVDAKAAGFDLYTSLSEVEADLLGDAEPVVIGPGGQLYLLDGHHTFTALLDSVWGADDPTVYVNVVANYSTDTEAQFIEEMQANNFLLPLNDGVPEPVADLPTSLTGLTSDVYRGLEYSILKNKSSKLFTSTNNITGAVGASTPGLDKMTGAYADFLEAAAYQGADNGLGLPYLSPGDIALATQWNLNPNSVTTLPSIPGTVTAAQLPGFILSQNITVSSVISNATLDENGTAPVDPNGDYEAGALAGTGSFDGVTEINAGTASEPILIGTPNIGFVMQLGNDKGFAVTLSNPANTYTGGTSILAGRLIIAGDGSLGAAPTETTAAFNSSLTLNADGVPDNVTAAVQADNGIIFNSLSEGNGTLTIGTTAGQYTASSPFTTSRPIAVGSEVATIDVNGSTVYLDGPLVTLGDDGVGDGETTGVSNLTIDDLSSGGGSTPTAGTLVLSTPSPDFYGDIIVGNTGTPTVEVMNDQALGSTTGLVTPSGQTIIGEIELNGGTLQTGASFSAPERNIVLDGGSQLDLDGNTTTWGTLTDVKRTIVIGNSSSTAAAITFNSFMISQTSTLQLDGKANGSTYSGNVTVTFTNGIIQSAPQDTLILNGSSSSALGSTEKVFSSGASATLVDGIAPVWIVTNEGNSKGVGPYDFVTYGANGYVQESTNSKTLSATTGSSVVELAANAAASGNVAAYALNTNGFTISLGSNTLTLGDGTDPAGLILDASSATKNSNITGGVLAFDGSQGVIWTSVTGGSTPTPTISSTITGSNGLTFAGGSGVVLSGAVDIGGQFTIDSGTVTLSSSDAGTGLATDVAGVELGDVKSHPANSTLDLTASQTFTTLNTVGSDAAINLSNSAALTLGDTVNNLSSTLSSPISETGPSVAGALTFDGSGLFDLSGEGGKDLSLVSGSTIVVNNSAQLRVVANEFANANFSVTLNGSSQLQFAQNGGGVFANDITGTGELHLIGGTLQLTEAAGANTYSGGTVVETGSTFDLTTNQVSTGNANITDAGGLIVFDQDFAGTFSGVISDGQEMGTGPMLSGSLDIDDSAADSASSDNVTLAAVQAYSGATYVEAGTLTLGAANAVEDSSGLTLGRVGGAVSGIVGGAASGPTYMQTANLVLDANQQLNSLTNNAGNTTTVTLNGNTLTLMPAVASDSDFSGVISDGSASGSVVADGAGTVTLGGDNTFSGGMTIDAGTLELASTNAAGTGAITFSNDPNATLLIDLGDDPSNLINGFAFGDAIDFVGVGLETAYSYSGGVLQLTGGAQTAQVDIAAPPASENFVLSSDGNGGTLVTLVGTPSISGAGNTTYWTQGQAPAAIDSTLSVSEANGTTLSGATVAITSGLLAGDQLNFTNQNGITGSYNASSGVLTLTGVATIAEYQQALLSVTYNSTSSSPSEAGADSQRTISWQVSNGFTNSNAATSTVDVGQIYTLTTGVDTINAGAGNDIIDAAAGTLSSGDMINGGGGINDMVLQGAGIFNLAAPATLANIATVIAYEGQAGALGFPAQNQIVDGRAGTDLMISVQANPNPNPKNSNPSVITIDEANNSDTVDLGPGTDVVTVGGDGETFNGGGGLDTYIVNKNTIGATINGTGGQSVLEASGGGAMTMGSSITGVSLVKLVAASTAYNFTANSDAPLTVDDLSTATSDTLTAGGAGQILEGGGAGKVSFVGFASGGDTFLDTSALFNHDAIANFGANGDTIDFTDINPTAADFSLNYAQGSGSGTLTVSDGMHSAALTLFGTFIASDFQHASDGGTGTDVTYHLSALA